MTNIGHRTRGIGDFLQIGFAVVNYDPARLLNRLDDGNDVGSNAFLQQDRNVLKDVPVVIQVEIPVGNKLADLAPGFVIQQQAANHRLLSLDRVWKQVCVGSDVSHRCPIFCEVAR